MKITTDILILLACLLLLAGCGNIENKDEPTTKEHENIETEVTNKTSDDIIADLRESTVMIYAGELHGTGVVIGNDGETITLASVAHLMKGYDQGIVTFFSGKTGFANVVYIDDYSDICLLTMKVSDFYEDFGADIKPVTIEEERLEKLNQYDRVLLLGSAINVGVNATYGEIGSNDYYVPEYSNRLIYLYADAMSGMSGSGCYTEDGVLIGILSAGSDNSEVLCIKINDILNKWDKLK